jgi:hypothetical protein
MVWYYRLDLEKAQNCKTEIPQEQWEKKKVLPYRKTYGEVAGIEIFDTEVVETIYKAPDKVLSLDELKIEKYKSISNEVHAYVTDKYPYYKQLSALNGTYDEATCLEITTFCDNEVKRALSIKEAINKATTKKAVEAIYYRKVIFADDDEMQMEPIGYTFWGE